MAPLEDSEASPNRIALRLRAFVTVIGLAILLPSSSIKVPPSAILDYLNGLLEESREASPTSALATESAIEPMSARYLKWEHILKVFAENEGKTSETARQLKIHRRTLQRKLQKRPVAD